MPRVVSEPTLSVIIPTHNRRASIVHCLKALAAQSLPCRRYDAVVIDDGSTDGTRDAIENLALPYSVSCHTQPNLGPAAARNRGISEARGDIVLFIGDDVIAGERLLEQHLRGHHEYPAESAAILGRLDWPPWRSTTPLMDFVCGPGHLQFAFENIRRMPRLDYRFFYTSNVSVKRGFLECTGQNFDASFRHAAFEDTEFAYRLQKRGLTLHYRDTARAVHDHVIDLESYVRREERAGEMAVMLYRKHPELDHVTQVGVLAEPLEALDRLTPGSIPWARLIETVTRADGVLRRIAAALDGPVSPISPGKAYGSHTWAVDVAKLRQDVWFVVFYAARGKVRALVGDADAATLAKAQASLAGVPELDVVRRAWRALAEISPADASLLTSIANEVPDLRRELEDLSGVVLPRTGAFHRRLRHLATGTGVSTALRSFDVLIEHHLAGWRLRGALAWYRALRRSVKRRLF